MNNTYNEALSHAAAFCSRCEHCKADILTAISKYGLSSEEKELLTEYLEKEGYLDEGRYARSYASDQFRFHHWGRLKIRHMLKEKHIPDSLIDDALNVIPEEEYFKTLRKIVLDKISDTAEEDDYRLAAKVLRHACGKGYELECVRKCLSSLSIEASSVDCQI